MAENIVKWFTENLNGNPVLIVFIISLFPILELRGGLIAAKLLGVPYLTALPVSMIGNILPIPFILLLITKIFAWLKTTKWMAPKIEKLEKKAMGKADKIEKAEFIGLLLFVGIPLPGTGAWTGSLIAALLGVKLKRSVPAILLGVVLAATLMSIFTYGIPALFGK